MVICPKCRKILLNPLKLAEHLKFACFFPARRPRIDLTPGTRDHAEQARRTQVKRTSLSYPRPVGSPKGPFEKSPTPTTI